MSTPKGQCPQCKNENEYSKVVCDFCGARLPWAHAVAPKPQSQPQPTPLPQASQSITTANDQPNLGWAILGFLVPVIGIILWLIMRSETPLRARSIGRGTAAGFAAQFFGTIAILTILGAPVATRAGIAAKQQSSASNMKQLGLAVMQAMQANNEKFPAMRTPEELKASTTPYLDKEQLEERNILISPLDGQPYQPNPALSNYYVGKIENPATIVMLYESTPTQGTRGVLYADGHYRLIRESEWPTLKAASGIQ
jgi:hypothetical protein